MGGAFGLTNLPFDVVQISGEATPSDKMMDVPETIRRIALMDNRTYPLSLNEISKAIKKLS
ncbi:hypothetical protein CWB58_04100 [Pseudoalteromonas sp. S201]|nr:hypothetical protein CWB81_09925 [Pseudoalteromonas sp. S1688]TMS94575.1 hypothetical protein CWB58_04100 [Pseudoalteromonas sp. S201]